MSLVDKLNALTWGGSPLYGEYAGELKGADTAKAQLDLQNKLTQDSLNQQKAIRDKIIASTDKYTTGGGEGYDPSQFAAMISRFLNQNSQTFNQARGQVISSLNTRGVGGGEAPGGGDAARGLENLEGAKASSQAQGVLGANIENLQQAITNRFNALNVQSGQAAQVGENVGTFNAGASDSLKSYITAKNTSPFMSMLGSALGTAAGAGIASSLGGLSKVMKRPPVNPPATG